MKRLALAAAIALPLTFSGCQQAAQVADTVCTDMAAMPPAAAAALNSIDPHSALGVYWLDAKSACLNGAPIAAVSGDWRGAMWQAVKMLIPQVLPSLLPMLVGLL
jgi:hypothetical protein